MADKPRKATAIEYDPRRGGSAPKVLAGGIGEVAERILAIAREKGIPIHEDPDLAELLSRVDVGTEIPEELYLAVAEVLAFLYRTGRGREGKDQDGHHDGN